MAKHDIFKIKTLDDLEKEAKSMNLEIPCLLYTSPSPRDTR